MKKSFILFLLFCCFVVTGCGCGGVASLEKDTMLVQKQVEPVPPEPEPPSVVVENKPVKFDWQRAIARERR